MFGLDRIDLSWFGQIWLGLVGLQICVLGWFVTWVEKDMETQERDKRLAKKDKLAKVHFYNFYFYTERKKRRTL